MCVNIKGQGSKVTQFCGLTLRFICWFISLLWCVNRSIKHKYLSMAKYKMSRNLVTLDNTWVLTYFLFSSRTDLEMKFACKILQLLLTKRCTLRHIYVCLPFKQKAKKSCKVIMMLSFMPIQKHLNNQKVLHTCSCSCYYLYALSSW